MVGCGEYPAQEIDMELSIGQTWRDKDKRRAKTGVVKDFNPDTVWVLIDGTSEEKEYARHRFIERWAYVEPVELPITYATREEWLQAAIKLISERVFGDTRR